jgi:uncharacterized protein YdeI (YjbR/CyaY-like superfamily)
MNPKVNFYFIKENKWQEEFRLLRMILLDTGLEEKLKWGHPCYTLDNKNIVLMHGFKDYCALLFFKGALMKDTKGILIQQTPNVQVPRQIRFTNSKEIVKLRSAIRSYVLEAIKVEKAGLKVELKKTSDFPVPEEFKKKLKEDPALNSAFKTLTPGRQKAYLFYFAQAKQSKTREARIQKYVKQILKGKGLDD